MKQYKRLMEMDNVNLKFTDGALAAIAGEAIRNKAGARGLRAVMERAMLDVMYETPSNRKIREVVINEDVILRKDEPLILYGDAA